MGSGKGCDDSTGIEDAIRPSAREGGPQFMPAQAKTDSVAYLKHAQLWRRLRRLHPNLVFNTNALKRALRQVQRDLAKDKSTRTAWALEKAVITDWVETTANRIRASGRHLSQTTRKHPRMKWLVELWGALGTPGVLPSAEEAAGGALDGDDNADDADEDDDDDEDAEDGDEADKIVGDVEDEPCGTVLDDTGLEPYGTVLDDIGLEPDGDPTDPYTEVVFFVFLFVFLKISSR